MQVKIINQSEHPLPEYATPGSSGMDLRSNNQEPQLIEPFQRVLIPTGLFMELPLGYEAQIRPRSGLALRHGITCLNTPGTIDADYRGEIKVLLINLGGEPYTIQRGERIAQLVIQKVEHIRWESVEELDNTQRSAGGFGSTGHH
jgi:dUTP pyrophosphatase